MSGWPAIYYWAKLDSFFLLLRIPVQEWKLKCNWTFNCLRFFFIIVFFFVYFSTWIWSAFYWCFIIVLKGKELQLLPPRLKHFNSPDMKKPKSNALQRKKDFHKTTTNLNNNNNNHNVTSTTIAQTGNFYNSDFHSIEPHTRTFIQSNNTHTYVLVIRDNK